MRCRKKLNNLKLQQINILILINQDIAKDAPPFLQQRRVAFQKAQTVGHHIIKINFSKFLHHLLIGWKNLFEIFFHRMRFIALGRRSAVIFDPADFRKDLPDDIRGSVQIFCIFCFSRILIILCQFLQNMLQDMIFFFFCDQFQASAG